MKVQDCGPRDAKIMLIGEAPGEQEERQGRPFVGASGKILKSMLSHSGINFAECYVTNVVDTRPPSNNFSFFYNNRLPSKHLESAWRKLQNKVESIRPEVIITLGAEPLKALCNVSEISKYRGTWLKFRGINVMPTYHPSYILRVYSDHPVVELDFVKAKRNKPKPLPTVPLRPSIDNVITFVKICIANKSRISFDIETIENHIRCLGMAAKIGGKLNTICIPFIQFTSSSMVRPSAGSTIVHLHSSSGSATSYWSPQQEQIVIDQIDRLFRSGIEMVGQNSISFDEPMLNDEFYLSISNHYMDTMHAWHCLYPEFLKSLDFLNSVLFDYPNYSINVDHTDDIQEWTYCSMDAIITLEASYKIENEMKGVKL